MKIQKINFLPQKQQPIQKENHQQNNSLIQNNSYNPIAYQDFNINFGARLFRTPENFYAQPFNQNGMPETMKEYLYDDFEDRQKMPPAQMLKVVFSDIKNAKSLEEVKQAYPEEKLFNKLSDTPNRKARTGILAEIDLLKEPNKSLFKNGKDNLGLYILNKIYIEGKTLKEINTDFVKDISVHYKGLSPIEYDTLSAYGIKYPNNGFWKSMTATRAEFPYEYKPRKEIESRITHQNNKSNNATSIKPKNKFQDVQNWEVDKLSEALIKGNGSKSETEKQLKKRNVQNKESQNFVSQYMGEINTIVLEKLHISEDMKDFFEKYDGLSKNQKEKFDEYMKIPYINELRSKVMSHTIRLFFDTYGVDGNNEDFQELLQYAHNIKPNRIARQAEHDRLQAEYEEALGIFDTVEEAHIQNDKIEEVTVDDDDNWIAIEDFKTKIEEMKKKFDVNTYEFETKDGEKVVVVSDLKGTFYEKLDQYYPLLPSSFAKKYAEFTYNHPLSSENYLLSIVYNNDKIKKDDRFLPQETVQDITIKIANDYVKEYPSESESIQQAIIDAAIANHSVIQDLYSINPIGCAILTANIAEDNKDKEALLKNISNKKITEYKKQYTTKEVLQITNKITSILEHVNQSDITTPLDIKNPMYLAKLVMSYDNKSKTFVKSEIQKLLKQYGGSARCLLDDKLPDDMKALKVERILYFKSDFAVTLLNRIKSDPKLFMHISQFLNYDQM